MQHLELKQLKLVHIEELHAYNSFFFASIDYEGGMCAFCRFPNGFTLTYLKTIIMSKLLVVEKLHMCFIMNHCFLLN